MTGIILAVAAGVALGHYALRALRWYRTWKDRNRDRIAASRAAREAFFGRRTMRATRAVGFLMRWGILLGAVGIGLTDGAPARTPTRLP
jgi:hypothetical protein